MFLTGDIVVDTKHNELFRFDKNVDGFLLSEEPGRLRHATELEIQLFNNSPNAIIKLPTL